MNAPILARLNLTSLEQQTVAAFVELSTGTGADADASEASPSIHLSVEQVVELWLDASISLEGREQALEQAACAGQSLHCNATISHAQQPSARRLQDSAPPAGATVPSCNAPSDGGPRITSRSVLDSSALVSADSLALQVQAALGAEGAQVCVAATAIVAIVVLEESAAGNGTMLIEALRRALELHEVDLPSDMVATITYVELRPPPPFTPSHVAASPPSADRTGAIPAATTLLIVMPLLVLIALMVAYRWRRQRLRLCIQRRAAVECAPTPSSSQKMGGTWRSKDRAGRVLGRSHKSLSGGCISKEAPPSVRSGHAMGDALSSSEASVASAGSVAKPRAFLKDLLEPPSAGSCGYGTQSSIEDPSLPVEPLSPAACLPSRPAPHLPCHECHASSIKVYPDVMTPPRSLAPADDDILPAADDILHADGRPQPLVETSLSSVGFRVATTSSAVQAMRTSTRPLRRPQRPAPVLAERRPHQVRRSYSDTTHVRRSAADSRPAHPSDVTLSRVKTMGAIPDVSRLHSGTLFDDGRYLQALMHEAQSIGWLPAESKAGEAEAPPLLRQLTSMALAAKPIETDLAEGPDGGGGVCVAPMHLDVKKALLASSMAAHFSTPE